MLLPAADALQVAIGILLQQPTLTEALDPTLCFLDMVCLLLERCHLRLYLAEPSDLLLYLLESVSIRLLCLQDFLLGSSALGAGLQEIVGHALHDYRKKAPSASLAKANIKNGYLPLVAVDRSK